MSGAKLEVVAGELEDGEGSGIVMARLALNLGATPQKTTESGEGFRLLTKGKRLLIRRVLPGGALGEVRK
ncbi:MAG: hypothetical protein NTW87_00065 [Planctomycetota bacterium]|nr:hypothetical protein [Planctomycetota bacterium]